MARKPYLVRRVTIRGQIWRIVIGRPPLNKCDGVCRYSERTIYIRPSAEPFSTAVHEVLHACFPDIEELAIIEAEVAIVTTLRAIAPKRSRGIISSKARPTG